MPHKEDETRGILCTRRYGRWVKYNKGGEPKLTGNHTEDGYITTKFFEASQYLWQKMDEAFPKELCEKVYRDLTEYEIKSNGLERICEP